MNSCRPIAMFLVFCLAGTGAVEYASAGEPYSPPAVKDANETINSQLRDQWRNPPRHLWRIAYHPIDGMTTHSAWHIEGTHWWVRIHPERFKLDEFDKTAVYELDAVALDQNYGVIDFYVYRREIMAK
jgi:hypothetical protein